MFVELYADLLKVICQLMRDQLLSNAATARSLGAWLLTSDRRAGSPEVKDR